jgi:branched-chain amino acid transport system substrate-binding protein
VTIGALVRLSDDDTAGRKVFEAVSLAVDGVNRRGGIELPGGERRLIRLAAYDDFGHPEIVATALRRLVEADGAIAVIGPSTRETASAARRLAEQLEIPLIALDASADSRTTTWRWSFALAPPDDAALVALVTYLSASGVQRLGWLAPGTAHAADTRTALARLTEATKQQVVGDEVYPIGDTELAERYRRLQTLGAQVVLAWPHDVRGAAALMGQLGLQRNWVPLFLGPVAVDPTTLGVVGDAADGVHSLTSRLRVADDLWDHDALTPAVRDFIREFRLRYGSPPDDDSAAAWDALHLVARVAKQSPTRPGIRDSLERLTDQPAVSGPITFTRTRHTGLDDRTFVVARAAAGRWRLPP